MQGSSALVQAGINTLGHQCLFSQLKAHRRHCREDQGRWICTSYSLRGWKGFLWILLIYLPAIRGREGSLGVSGKWWQRMQEFTEGKPRKEINESRESFTLPSGSLFCPTKKIAMKTPLPNSLMNTSPESPLSPGALVLKKWKKTNKQAKQNKTKP